MMSPGDRRGIGRALYCRWRIAAASFIFLFTVVGPVFYAPLIEEFGWTRAGGSRLFLRHTPRRPRVRHLGRVPDRPDRSPVAVKAHRYVREIARGRFENAYLVVRESMPFLFVCGTVCYHPCEARCRRGRLGDPVAVRSLKVAAVEKGRRKPVPAEASGFELRFDSVLSAVGQSPAIPKDLGIEADPKSQQISVLPDSLATAAARVFAGAIRFRGTPRDDPGAGLRKKIAADGRRRVPREFRVIQQAIVDILALRSRKSG